MKSETTSTIPKSKLALPIAGRDHIQGPIDAPFTLLEYGDFECPYCGAAYPEIKAVQERLGDRLCFAFRNFPLVNSHPRAQHAAEAAEAAGAQGRYWEMHDLLFERQEALEDEDLARYATALGLDARRLVAEVLTGAHVARVREDFRSGARAGVNGTPTLFINGVRFSGSPDAHALLAVLKERPWDKPTTSLSHNETYPERRSIGEDAPSGGCSGTQNSAATLDYSVQPNNSSVTFFIRLFWLCLSRLPR